MFAAFTYAHEHIKSPRGIVFFFGGEHDYFQKCNVKCTREILVSI